MFKFIVAKHFIVLVWPLLCICNHVAIYTTSVFVPGHNIGRCMKQKISFVSTTNNKAWQYNRNIASSKTVIGSTRDDKDQSMNASCKNLIVVGGGVGGLAVAARISARLRHNDNLENGHQWNVKVYEMNDSPGGRCGSFNVTHELGKFRHERGPSLLLLPHIYEQLFSDVTRGTKTADDFGLHMLPCQPAYQVVFDDGDQIDVGFPKKNAKCVDIIGIGEADALEQISRNKMNTWEIDGATHWDDYLRACSAFLDCGLPNFIEQRFDLPSFPAFIVEALRDFGRAWPLKPHSDVLDAIFESNKLKALASFQDLYVGLEPYRNNALLGGGILQSTAPAVFGLLAAIELHPTNSLCGVFAPEGGFQKVTESIISLAESVNVTVECSTTVTKVTEEGVYVLDEGSGVSRLHAADLVIVNADLPYATKSLIDKSSRTTKQDHIFPVKYDWDTKYLFSSGVIAFHWSLSKSFDDLNTHNVFMYAGSNEDSSGRSSYDCWKALRQGQTNELLNQAFSSVNEPFNFYLHRASKTDPSAAPKGMDSIMILVPCKPLKNDPACSNLTKSQAIEKYKEQFDEIFIASVREAVLHRLSVIPSLTCLSEHIVDEVLDTPATSADAWNVGAGTPFGISHGFAQLSVNRPGFDSSGLSNTLFCGASTRPGNGVPLVLVGAKLVADKALKKINALNTTKGRGFLK